MFQSTPHCTYFIYQTYNGNNYKKKHFFFFFTIHNYFREIKVQSKCYAFLHFIINISWEHNSFKNNRLALTFELFSKNELIDANQMYCYHNCIFICMVKSRSIIPAVDCHWSFHCWIDMWSNSFDQWNHVVCRGRNAHIRPC